MKKIYMFLALLLMNGFIYAQFQRASQCTFSTAKANQPLSEQTGAAKAVLDSIHYDGINNDGSGAGAGVYGFYAYFPHDSIVQLSSSATHLVAMKVFIKELRSITSFTMKIFTDTTGTTMLHSQQFFPVEGWNEILLSAPITIPTTGGLCIGYELVSTGTTYAAGCDAGPTAANGNGNWVYFDDAWNHIDFHDYHFIINWNIRAMFGTLPTLPTVLCAPLRWDAGIVTLPESVTSNTFTISNIGATGPLTCSGITGISAPFSITLNPASLNLAGSTSSTFTITYAPTAVATDNQTVVIATNGGDVTINLSGRSIDCSAIKTFPWIESFEGADFPTDCWTKANFDGGRGWDHISVGATLPSGSGGEMTTPEFGGSTGAYCSWSTGGGDFSDQWLITPQIAVKENQKLSFYIFYYGGGFSFYDTVDVKISTLTNNPADFTTTLMKTNTTNIQFDNWTKKIIDLSAYANQNVYLAFHEHVPDHMTCGTFIGLDLVTVDINAGIEDIQEELISVYPNPANDKLFIAANNLKSVEIFNIVGEKICSHSNQNLISTSDLTVGSYIVVVRTNSKVVTRKINIVR